MNDYQALQAMDWDTAQNWFHADARDDFFPDPLRYDDLRCPEYLAIIQHQRVAFRRQPWTLVSVPKAGLLSRQTAHLPPAFRLPYTAVLVTLLPVLKKRLTPHCYSFRSDAPTSSRGDPFPTIARLTSWSDFQNDFRQSLMAQSGLWGVVTDIATFFEHISPRELCRSLRDLIEPTEARRIEPYVKFLEEMLSWACPDAGGIGIPQNYDPSSFFCSAMLTSLDREMAKACPDGYFRYVDDIRLVTRSYGDAVSAVQVLQAACRKRGLFLNTKKTKVIPPDAHAVHPELDATHDAQISEIETALLSGQLTQIRRALTVATAGLSQSLEKGDGRHVRAYAGRLFEAGKIGDLREECFAVLTPLCLEQLRSRPDQADQWVRFISPQVGNDTAGELVSILNDSDYNRYEWVNMHLVIALSRAPSLEGRAMDALRRVAAPGSPVSVRGRAIVALGRLGDNVERRAFLDLLTGQTDPFLRRCAIIASQELSTSSRDDHWKRAMNIDPELKPLCELLSGLKSPRYDTFKYEPRRELARQRLSERGDGVGLVRGKFRTFKRSIDVHSGYE